MRKLIIALVILLILSGIVVVAIRNLSGFINRNKDYLLAQAEQTLGRQVVVDEIEATVWGGIGVRLINFAVADDPTFSSDYFLRAANLQVNVEFFPLLWQELRVKRLILHQPTIAIIRNQQGQFNFASLGNAGTAEQSPPEASEEATESPSAAAAIPPSLFAALVNISRGEVQYVDRQEKTDLRISQLDLTVEDVSFDQPISFNLNAAVLAEQQNLKLQGHIGPLGSPLEPATLPVEGMITLDPLDVNALQQALPQITTQLPQGLGLSGPLRAATTVSGTAGALTLSEIELTAAVFAARKPNLKFTGRLGPLGQTGQELALNGDVELGPVTLAQLQQFAPLAGTLPPDLSAEGPLSLQAHVEGTPHNLAVSGTVEATASTIRIGDQLRKPQGSPLVLATDARVTPTMVALQQATLRLHTLALIGSGEINLGQPPSLNLTVEAKPTSLAGWQDLLPPLQGADLAGTLELQTRVQGPVAEGKIPQINGSLTLSDVRARVPQLPAPLTDLNAKVAFTGHGAEFTDTSLRLGNSPIRLDGQVKQFVPLTLTYHLSAPTLRMADLQTDAATGNESAVLQEVTSDGRIQMDNGALTYQGRLSSAQGTFAQIPYEDFHTAVSVTPQAATIENASLRAFGGSVQGTGRYELQQTPPQFTLTSQVQGLNLTELFQSALTTASQHLQGQATLDLQLTGSGQEWEEIKPSLQGQGQAEVVQGALLDVNIAEGVLSGITGIPGLSLVVSPKVRNRYPEIFSTQNTPFEELRSTFTFSDGKMNIEELRLSAADYTVRGDGWVNFDQKLDLQGQLILSQKLSADIVDDVKEAKYIVNEQERLEIPFALAGTLPQVKPRPDLAYVSRLVQRAALRKGAEELEKRVLRKLLPREERPSAAESETSPTSPPSAQRPPEKNLKDQLLRKGLESLFGR